MFKSGTYAQSIVTGATFHKMDESTCNAELLNIVKTSLLAAAHNELEYKQLDKYLLAYFLCCTNDDLLRLLEWKHFVLHDSHVFNETHLVDIGRNIRHIIVGDVQSETMTRIIFFSLPYLKHNRLTLPPINETKFHELQNCLRIMHASLLGMLQPSSKKPPWKMRVQLHVFTSHLLLNCTHQDMHMFFKNHLAVLRISLIEYVIYFIQKNMQMEQHVFQKLFSLNSNGALQFEEMLCLINTFRIQAFDDGMLDTMRLNEKAMLTLERCNRMCACKVNPTNIFSASHSPSTTALSRNMPELVQLSFEMPKISSRVLLHALHVKKSFHDVCCIAHVQASVSVQPLPHGLYLKQIKSLQTIYNKHALKAVYTTRCSFCVLCGLKHDMLDDKMRIQDDTTIFCSGCESSKHVLTVNTLGVLLNVRGMTLFWCPCCCVVHKWLATGYDFDTCAYTRAYSPSTVKNCLICKKRNGLQDIEVLQADLGFICTTSLCYKHRPWDYQLNLVTDLDSLKTALQAKRNMRPSY